MALRTSRMSTVAGPARRSMDGDQGLDDGPLVVGQVGGVGLTHRGMLRRRCDPADLLKQQEFTKIRITG